MGARAKDNLPLLPAQLEPLPTVEGGWPCIEADPPWYYRSWTPSNDEREDRSVERHYRTMRFSEILDMPVRQIAAPDAHLWLWITGPFLNKFEEVMNAWGFRYSATGFVWMKLKKSVGGDQYQMISLSELDHFLHFGLGHTTRKNVEFCLLGRRGNAKRMSKNVREPILSPVREHSRKPDEAYERIERYCAGPRLSLFSRSPRENWTVWGNETDKFGE